MNCSCTLPRSCFCSIITDLFWNIQNLHKKNASIIQNHGTSLSRHVLQECLNWRNKGNWNVRQPNLWKRQTLFHSICDAEEFSFRKDSSSTADPKHLPLDAQQNKAIQTRLVHLLWSVTVLDMFISSLVSNMTLLSVGCRQTHIPLQSQRLHLAVQPKELLGCWPWVSSNLPPSYMADRSVFPSV